MQRARDLDSVPFASSLCFPVSKNHYVIQPHWHLCFHRKSLKKYTGTQIRSCSKALTTESFLLPTFDVLIITRRPLDVLIVTRCTLEILIVSSCPLDVFIVTRRPLDVLICLQMYCRCIHYNQMYSLSIDILCVHCQLKVLVH